MSKNLAVKPRCKLHKVATISLSKCSIAKKNEEDIFATKIIVAESSNVNVLCRQSRKVVITQKTIRRFLGCLIVSETMEQTDFFHKKYLVRRFLKVLVRTKSKEYLQILNNF